MFFIKWMNITFLYLMHTNPVHRFKCLGLFCSLSYAVGPDRRPTCCCYRPPSSLISPDDKRLASTPHFTLGSANRQWDRLTRRGMPAPWCKTQY